MKNILKYLWSTKDLFLIFGEGLELRVGGYTDVDDRMSISRCVLGQYVETVPSNQSMEVEYTINMYDIF